MVEPYPMDMTNQYALVVEEALLFQTNALLNEDDVPMVWKGHDYGPVGMPKWQQDMVEDSVWWNDAPYVVEPFVVDGNGAPKGLSPEEHIEFAKTLPHPMDVGFGGSRKPFRQLLLFSVQKLW